MLTRRRPRTQPQPMASNRSPQSTGGAPFTWCAPEPPDLPPRTRATHTHAHAHAQSAHAACSTPGRRHTQIQAEWYALHTARTAARLADRMPCARRTPADGACLSAPVGDGRQRRRLCSSSARYCAESRAAAAPTRPSSLPQLTFMSSHADGPALPTALRSTAREASACPRAPIGPPRRGPTASPSSGAAAAPALGAVAATVRGAKMPTVRGAKAATAHHGNTPTRPPPRPQTPRRPPRPPPPQPLGELARMRAAASQAGHYRNGPHGRSSHRPSAGRWTPRSAPLAATRLASRGVRAPTRRTDNAARSRRRRQFRRQSRRRRRSCRRRRSLPQPCSRARPWRRRRSRPPLVLPRRFHAPLRPRLRPRPHPPPPSSPPRVKLGRPLPPRPPSRQQAL
jgi:hypothetical protein